MSQKEYDNINNSCANAGYDHNDFYHPGHDQSDPLNAPIPPEEALKEVSTLKQTPCPAQPVVPANPESVYEINLDETASNQLDRKPDPPKNISSRKFINQRIKTRDLCVLTRQLATLMRAGMPLVPALTALVEQLQGQPFAVLIQEIVETVNAGAPLAEALKKYPHIFSNFYVNMVRAGQASGTLEEVLTKLAQTMENRLRLTGKIKATLAYPCLMAITAAAVVVFLVTFVVPSLAKIFLDMDRSLPWPTTFLIALSSFLRNYLVALALLLALFIFGVGAYLKTKTGKMNWDRFKLKLPLLGDLFLKIETLRLARTLGIMLSSGIPVLDALIIVKEITGNSFIASGLDSIRDNIGRGHSIALSFKQTGLFPPIMIHTISIGEMSGNVEEQLTGIAENYDEEIQVLARSLTALLEPAILLIMGLIIGFIVLATLLPIFEINQML